MPVATRVPTSGAHVVAAATTAAGLPAAPLSPGGLLHADAAPNKGTLYDGSVPGRTLFGMSVYTQGTETFGTAVGRLTGEFGGLPVARIYVNGMLPARWSDVAALRALPAQTAVVLSYKGDLGAIAAGHDDDLVRSFLASRPAGVKVWLVLWHEPEDDVERGTITADQFRAATAHIAPVVRNAGAVPTTILMQWTLDPASHRDWHAYYTPAVDVIGYDVYNTQTAGYRSPDDIIAATRAVSQQTSKPFGWAEIGSACTAGDPTCSGRAAWLTALTRVMAASEAQFASYWNRPDFNGGPDYTLTDPASQAAWRAAMR